MDFKTKYDAHERVFTNPGSMIKEHYTPVIDKYGNRVIESDGSIDLYSQIQSWKDECDINILMAKFTNGDKTALMQRVGSYMDISELPDNFNDIMNVTTKAQSLFDSLPTDIKNVFGNNVYNFLANAKTKEFAELMSKSPEDIRTEKIMKSKEATHNSIEESQVKYYSNPGSGLIDDGSVEIPVEPITDPVETTKNFLNRSK